MASIPRAKHVVTLVHAAGCHLCESARRVIEGVRTEVPFELEEVDITGDEELEGRYRERIPVVEVDGELVSELVLDRAALLARLDTVAGDDRAGGGGA